MKKNVIICLIIVLILLLGVFGFLILKGGKISVITLDINPSLELTLKRNKVIDIRALNNDGNDVITDNIKNSSLNDALDIIVSNLIENDYIKENEVTIILGMDDKDNNILDSVKDAFNNHKIDANVVVPVITEQAKKDAEAYNVSSAKAAYINEVIETNNELKFDDLTEKSTTELNTIKETGYYCDNGYTLVGTNCEKKVKEEKPDTGYTCPDGYEMINDKCYKTKETEDTLYCQTGTLKDGKCEGEVSTNAKAKCETGEYNSKTSKCEVLTLVGEATKTCKNQNMDPKDQKMSNGRCSGGKWAHDDNTCEGNDIFIADTSGGPNAGWCYNPSGDYDAIISCPSGQTVKDSKCYKAETSDPTYYCEGNAKLNGTKCLENKTVAASKKKACSSDYKLYEDKICVNYNETTARIEGYTCNKEARLEDNHCVYYEIIEAKH